MIIEPPKDRAGLIETMTQAVREEVVRQLRENERSKSAAGAACYEEHIGPYLVAYAVLSTLESAGWTVVPRGATIDMLWAAFQIDSVVAPGLREDFERVNPEDFERMNPGWIKDWLEYYAAMVAASPANRG